MQLFYFTKIEKKITRKLTQNKYVQLTKTLMRTNHKNTQIIKLTITKKLLVFEIFWLYLQKNENGA